MCKCQDSGCKNKTFGNGWLILPSFMLICMGVYFYYCYSFNNDISEYGKNHSQYETCEYIREKYKATGASDCIEEDKLYNENQDILAKTNVCKDEYKSLGTVSNACSKYIDNSGNTISNTGTGTKQ